MTQGLGSIAIEGLGSIRDLVLDLGTDVTVLIGANGAGKSNLVGAFELVARVWDGTFQEYLRRRGGISNLLFEGAWGRAEEVCVELLTEPGEGGAPNSYRMTVSPDPSAGGDDERAVLSEVIGLGFNGETITLATPHGSDGISRIQYFAEDYQGPNLRPLLEGCRVFHFDDVSANAPVKGWSTLGDDLSLRSNAENIAAYLHKVREEHPHSYRRIVSAVRAATPFFDDFVLKPGSNERIRLRWRQRGLDRVFTAQEASDGTLRFICLATLLLGPDLPGTVVLDEPELGLHPAAIGLLVEMIRAAAGSGRKVVIATQSVPLVSHFSIEEIAVLDRVDGATQVTRPDAQHLATFLDEYSTGNLWEMNLLGGRPQPEASV